MLKKVRFCMLGTGLLLAGYSYSQNPTPEITGDLMLCPQGSGTLTATPGFDSYQWLRRYIGSSNTELIQGETNQTLQLNYPEYAGSYISVEVTLGNDMDTSAEVLVDGWVFNPVVVASEGDFNTGPNGETILCDGDTMFFRLLEPYTTSITWKRNGDILPDEDSTVLAVTLPGNYHVLAAPGLCPNYIVPISVLLIVEVIDCDTTAGISPDPEIQSSVYPNPASASLTVTHPSYPLQLLTIQDATGKLVRTQVANQHTVQMPVEDLQRGIYFVTVHYGSTKEVHKIVLR